MRIYDIIAKKRDGFALSSEEIEFFVKGFTCGSIPDYQASALLMAIFINGMNDEETVCLTKAMANSGDTLDLSFFKELSCDKHSTGGVGDKTTLIVAPIVAALGGKLAKMSGRGLGHTGGTVDKLESISGYKTTLSKDEFLSQSDKIGVCVIGQSGDLAPADKKLYALRDVTATVNSIGLITSSIMSKKIAAGAHNIVLDVKSGSGAFMKTYEDAEILAKNMVKIGKGCGRSVRALITDMDTPLGTHIGNALEVKEAVNVLKGQQKDDLYLVCIELSAQIISLCFSLDEDRAREKVIDAIESGKAYEKMLKWIEAQGGKREQIENPQKLPSAKYSLEIFCEESGYIESMDCEKIGVSALILGAGREKKDDIIDFGAGIILDKKTGDKISKGDKICTLYTNKKEAFESAKEKFLSAVVISDKKPEKKPLIYKIIK